MPEASSTPTFTCPCGSGLHVVVDAAEVERFARSYDADRDPTDSVKVRCADPECSDKYEATLREVVSWLRFDLAEPGVVPATPSLAEFMSDGDPRVARLLLERGGQENP